MKTYTTQTELEVFVLKSMYDFVQTGSGFLSPLDVSNLLDSEFSVDRIAMALRSLESSKLVRSRHNAISGSSYSISDTGYRQAEEVLHQPRLDEDPEVPASDRIVTLTHNSENVRSAQAALSALSAQLAVANDVGGMTADEVEEAKREVWLIEQSIKQEAVRLDWIEPISKACLQWIALKAAEQIVGTLALAALAAIAVLFGFSV